MKTELGQVWKNLFGSVLPAQEEGEKLLVKVGTGEKISFGSFCVILGQVQDAIKTPIMLTMRAMERGSLYVVVEKEIPVKEEITGVKRDGAIDTQQTKKRKKSEVEEIAVSTEKGE